MRSIFRQILPPLAILVASVLLYLFFSQLETSPGKAAYDYTNWTDQGIVYTAPSGDAYYPSVSFDAGGFGLGDPLYKLWYSNGGGAAFLTTSTNGFAWSAPITLTGLGVYAHHLQVLYDAACFGATPCNADSLHYKIWYWDTGTLNYNINDIAYAGSSDGLTWSNDQAITQDASHPLVTGAGSGWNRGTYGPVALFYQAGAANSGSDPWDYSYVMYYDGTDGSSEETGLAYSADGLYWTAYSSNPVLAKGAGAAWDCDDAVYGSVYHNADGYHYWYSGGGGDNGSGSCQSGAPVYEGFGYAFSTDGINWTKDAGNPIFHIDDGVSYRLARVYTPAFLDDGSGLWKLYYSAQGATGPKKISLATLPNEPTAVLVSSFAGFPSQGGVLLAWETELEVDTLGFNLYRAEAINGEYQLVNPELIPTKMSWTPGVRYSYLDLGVLPGEDYFYQLEILDVSGTSTRLDPIEAWAGWQTFLPCVLR
jgi:hypothetical protein